MTDGPCPLCTHQTPDQCPGRSHRALCRHLECRPDLWAAKIASLPPSEAEPKDLSDLGPCPEPSLPSLLTQAANLAGAVARHVAAGRPQASPEVVEARLAICRVCDHYRASDGRCGGKQGCGCYVSIKASWEDQRCPLNRWPSSGPAPSGSPT